MKKAVCSSCLVLGCPEPRPVWVEIGVRLPVPSRLKGMETVHRIPRLNLSNSFSKCIFRPEYDKNKYI